MSEVLYRDCYRKYKMVLHKTNKTKIDPGLKQKQKQSCTHVKVVGKVQKKMQRQRLGRGDEETHPQVAGNTETVCIPHNLLTVGGHLDKRCSSFQACVSPLWKDHLHSWGSVVLSSRMDVEGKAHSRIPGQSLGPWRFLGSLRVRREGDMKDRLGGSFHLDEKTERSCSLPFGAVSFCGEPLLSEDTSPGEHVMGLGGGCHPGHSLKPEAELRKVTGLPPWGTRQTHGLSGPDLAERQKWVTQRALICF